MMAKLRTAKTMDVFVRFLLVEPCQFVAFAMCVDHQWNKSISFHYHFTRQDISQSWIQLCHEYLDDSDERITSRSQWIRITDVLAKL